MNYFLCTFIWIFQFSLLTHIIQPSFSGFGDSLFPVSEHPVPASTRVASKQLWEHRPRSRGHEWHVCQRPSWRWGHCQHARQVMTSETTRLCVCMCRQCLVCVNVCLNGMACCLFITTALCQLSAIKTPTYTHMHVITQTEHSQAKHRLRWP